MTQSLKIECLVTDLTLEGEIASFLVTKEQLTAGLSKKADLVDGKIQESNLPDFIANGFQTVNQKLSTLETSIADGIQSAKDYAEAYTDEKLIQKADLVDGKVPASQLPSISEYSGLSEALTSVLDQARRDMIERTDEIQRTKADIGEDGKVLREQLPNYDKIPGLETVIKDILDNKVDASDVYKKSETMDVEEIEATVERIAPTRTEVDTALMMSEVVQVHGFEHKYIDAGGYPFGAVLTLDDGITQVKSTVANNKNNPNSNVVGWTPHGVGKFIAGMSYDLNARVMLDNGDIVKSTIARNTNDPNLNMIGWNATQPFKTLYDFGAVGDGVTDDSDAIQAAFNYGKIFVTDGQFVVTKRILIRYDLVLIGLGGVLKPNVRGTVFQLNSNVKFVGDNLDIDGSLYPFNWNADQGMYAFGAISSPLAHLFVLTNSRIRNVYGSGVRVRAQTVIVKNNVLKDVTGNNWTLDPSGAYDNYGDGIHVMGCKVGVVEGNYVENTLIDQSDSYLGRCGIVTEFGANNVTIANNYVSGYDRGIHAESVYDNVIKNNSVEKCGASLLLSAAKNCTIESNTFTANRRFTVGTFIGYGNCYSYGANSGCSFLNNKIKVVTGLGYGTGYVAMLFSGSITIKDILVEGNIIEGGFSTNGGDNFYVQNNTFNADADLRTVFFNGSVSFLNNTFKEGVRLRAIGIGGKSAIEGNKFYDVASNGVLEVTNPASSGFAINNNKFYLKTGATNTSVISAYMASDKIGEMSGNVVIAPHTERQNLNLVDFAGSATLNKIYTLEPNLLINGIGEIQSLKISSVYGMSRNTLEFYKGGNTATEPDDDIYYQVGSRVYLADSTNSNNPAFFIALNSGYAAKTAWAAGASVSLGVIRYNGSNVYKADAAGTTGVTAPTHTSGSASDGGVSWTYLGAKSLFKSVGMKGAAVSNATGTDDTAVKLNALIASLKNAGLIQ